MKKYTIKREDLLSGKNYKIIYEELDEEGKVNIDKELEDYLFQLLKKVKVRKQLKGNGLGYLGAGFMGVITQTVKINIYVEKKELHILKQEIYSHFINAINSLNLLYHKLEAISVIVYEEVSQIKMVENEEYDKTINLGVD